MLSVTFRIFFYHKNDPTYWINKILSQGWTYILSEYLQGYPVHLYVRHTSTFVILLSTLLSIITTLARETSIPLIDMIQQ